MYSYLTTFINRSWTFWLSVGLIVLFILWLFYGGNDHEYVGLGPLQTGIDSSKYVDANKYRPYAEADPITFTDSYDPQDEESCYADWTEESSYGDSDIGSYDNSYSNNDYGEYNFSPSSKLHFNSSKYRYDLSNVKSSVTKEPSVTSLIKTDYNKLLSSYDKRKEEDKKAALGYGKFREYGNGKKRSKMEQKCKDILEKIYNKPFYTIRPDFLKNPETKRNLEIDLYNDELRIGCEAQGIQHYQWPNHTSQTHEQFLNQVRRDQFKVDMCDLHGIYLITVPHHVPDNELENYITYYLPENVRKRQLEDQKQVLEQDN